MIELVYGGSGSGKSEFAEKLILDSECENRFYIATMKIFDDEGKKRVERHRKLRGNKNFITIEETNESRNLEDAIEKIKKMSSSKNLEDSFGLGGGKSSEKKKIGGSGGMSFKSPCKRDVLARRKNCFVF